jgi:hypothetical protein
MDNLIELGFAQAGTGDALTSHAQTAMSLIVGFPENITDEARASLYAGYRKRWDANHPAKLYAVIDGNYVDATAPGPCCSRMSRRYSHRRCVSTRRYPQPPAFRRQSPDPLPLAMR